MLFKNIMRSTVLINARRPNTIVIDKSPSNPFNFIIIISMLIDIAIKEQNTSIAGASNNPRGFFFRSKTAVIISAGRNIDKPSI